MNFICIDPGALSGRIGPFWWINGIHYLHEIVGLSGTSNNLSRDLVWRSGGWGWSSPGTPLLAAINPLRWHIVQRLN